MKRILLVLFIFIPFFLYACDQDPIFWMISNEVEPRDPLIAGSPSKMVKIGSDIYVANGKLWWYSAGHGRWIAAGGPSNVYDIAGGDTTGLYMLQVKNSDTLIYKLGGGVILYPSGYMIQGLYSDGSEIFAGAMSGGAYSILKLTDGGFTFVRNIGSPLAGVTSKYFATAISGIFDKNKPEAEAVSGSPGHSIAGIIEVKMNGEDKTIAVTGGGNILDVSSGGVTPRETGVWKFTGAMAVYTKPGQSETRPLLLLGAYSGVYDMGYREMYLNDDNFTLYSPGGLAPYSTVSNKDRYSATLAKCAVNSLMQAQAPDGSSIVFASTQKDGLWSCRGDEWNAEE